MTLFAAQGLGKRYTVRPERSIALGIVRKYRPRTLWALRGLDMSLEHGEVLAVIGRNGAGKSTLLKLAVGVTKATEGTVQRPSRIAPLIEVGAGFHPELTGRENIMVNGRLLGLSPRQINERADDIIDFAQIRHAIDQPVKQYSSGMYMRLGFAVAIHTDPELLVVDEVLAVGDLPFQVQCMHRIKEMRDAGVGVLFVSHNLGSVLDVADRCLLLDQGQLVAEGNPREVVGEYHRILESDPTTEIGGYESAYEMKLVDINAFDADGNSKALWQPHERVTVRMTFEATAQTPGGYFALELAKEGSGACAWWRGDHLEAIPPMSAGERITVEVGLSLHVVTGTYLLGVGMTRMNKPGLMTREEGAFRFAVGKGPGATGLVDLDADLEVLAADVEPRS